MPRVSSLVHVFLVDNGVVSGDALLVGLLGQLLSKITALLSCVVTLCVIE